MTVLRFLVRNWVLKLSAVALAVILYVAMVSIQSTQQWPRQVPIEPLHQPADSYLLKPDPWPKVEGIRFIAPADVPVSQSSFRATVDLTGVRVGAGENSLVRVQLVAEDARIQIVDYQPQQIRVTLDKIESKQVPVDLKVSVPADLTRGAQTLSASEVTATGASSLLARVSSARADVRVDVSGLDINEDAPLVPVDSSGNVVDNVQLDPPSVHVRIQIGSQIRTATVPVTPVIAPDPPAAGYYITSIDVTPPVISVSGQANALSLLNGIAATQPISIRGATGDVTVSVALNLPEGVAALGVTTIKVVVHLESPASTRTLSIGVVLAGARPDRAYTLSTANVNVTIGGATAALNAFDTSSFVATAPVGGLDTGTYPVTLIIDTPPGIKLVPGSITQINVTVSVAPATPVPSA
jgi:YbbR domain-containing protein